MRSVRALAAVALSFFAASNVAASAAEPKQGGILRVYHRDSPASMSIHEEATYSVNVPDDGGLQQPRHVRPARARRTACESIVPDLADELGVERGRQGADLQAAPGRQMA